MLRAIVILLDGRKAGSLIAEGGIRGSKL